MSAKKLTCLDCGQINRVPVDRLAAAKCGTCGAKLLSAKARDVDYGVLQKAMRHDDLPLVVDFWAPWCGPCRQMAPQFAQAATQLQGQARLVKLNTEAFPQAGAKHNIRGIPTMAAFQAGREKARQAGAQSAGAIVAWVQQLA